MVGVYGVMAYNVRRQRREFGIRIALGADQSRMRNLVVGRGLTLSAAGVSIGAFAAWLLTGLLKTMLNDVNPTDLTVFGATAAVVLFVAVAASYFPARSAGRVDPMVVLRDAVEHLTTAAARPRAIDPRPLRGAPGPATVWVAPFR